MAKFKTTTLDQGTHWITVRSELNVDGDTEVVEYTLDASDGSELEQRLAAQGGLGANRLARVRAQLQERARTKAQTIARDRLVERRMTTEERTERATRRPRQPLSVGLRAAVELAARIDKARG